MSVGLVAIAQLISLEVTRQMVAAGLGLGFDGARYVAGAPALAITDATNTTPIVITTAQPHAVASLAGYGSLGGASVVISGVAGNEAANAISDAEDDLAIGLPRGVLAVPVDDVRLALYAQDESGALAPLRGSGTYSGGGTMVPALSDGGIMLGREYVAAYAAPPRIVMIPMTSAFVARSNAVPRGSRTADLAAQRTQRAVRTERVTFEVRVWGQASPPHVSRDFDATRDIAHMLEDSIHQLTAGVYELGSGSFVDQAAKETQRLKAGHEFVFNLTLNTPVTDAARAMIEGVTIDAEGRMQINGATTFSVACQGSIGS